MLALVVALAVQACAVGSSSDCAEKASCAEPADTSDDVANREPDAAGPAGPDAADGSFAGVDAAPRDAASADVTSVDSAAPDGANREAAIADGPGADVPGDARQGDASEDVVGADAAPDAGAPDGAGACVPAGPENCTNGVDDDCNGKADCADPACAAYACAPPVPAGWYGWVALAEVPSGTALPACPAAYEDLLDANLGVTAPAATCGCTCQASGQACSATGTFHGDQACSTSVCATVTASSSVGCAAVSANSCGSGGSFNLTATPAPSGGSCAPKVSSTTPPASWSTSARLCSYVGAPGDVGGCSNADRCVASPASPYRSTACIYSTADPPPSSCPAGYDAAPPTVLYSAMTDTRGCGSCTCSGPTGGSCTGTLSLFGGAGCSGASGSASYALGASCQAYSGLSPVPGSVAAHFSVTPGACSVQAAPQPTGGVTPETPTTVCCM